MNTESFKVKQSALKNVEQDIRRYQRMIREASDSVRETKNVINGMKGGITFVCGKLERYGQGLDQKAVNFEKLASVLTEIVFEYEKTEAILGEKGDKGHKPSKNIGNEDKKGFFDILLALIRKIFGYGEDPNRKESEIDSIVFDEDGMYGGDQGKPFRLIDSSESFSNQKFLIDTIRNHFPEMSDAEIREYLIKMNTEGCSYVATINTIFAAFEGREKEFEKTFGFPMYRNGDLNYDELLVDFYCETDNHNLSLGRDRFNPKEDKSSTEGKGTTLGEQRYRAEMYLKNRNVDVTIEKKSITPDNFKEYSKEGYVVLRAYEFELEDYNGNPIYNSDAGHAMTITGVTEDGRYIVSSWGEKYYYDPKLGKNNSRDFLYYKYN